MRAADRCVSVLVSAAVAATAGCGGGASSVPPGATNSNAGSRGPAVVGTPLPAAHPTSKIAKPFSLQAGVNYIYIADQDDESIDIFPLQATCLGEAGAITAGIAGPYGLWFDAKSQSLIVANQSNNTVTVYASGANTPSVTYSQGLSRPLYPIVDQNENLYVGNGNTGTIVEYLAGSTTVARTLQTPGVETDGLAFDQQGDLFAAYRTGDDFGQGGIVEFPAGSSVGTQLGVTLTAPQALLMDENGNAIVVETEDVNRVDVFASGATTPAIETASPNSSTPTGLALDSAEGHLYLSTLGGNAYGSLYPLSGKTFFLQDELSTTTQGLAISTNQSF